MPELPEVETIRRELIQTVLGKQIVSTTVYLPRAFENQNNLDVRGQITDINRHGKYLLLSIGNCCTLCIHLRMTGKLIYCKSNAEIELNQKHNRVIFHFKGKDCLVFNDIRSFGKVEVLPPHTCLSNVRDIGIDAISGKLSLQFFIKLCSKKKVPIKSLLLDQTQIAGIGNIYAMEILFMARISPLRLASSLNDSELLVLHKSIKKILKSAIKHNGTTISDFRRVDDKTGEFQNFLQVYGKVKCPVCNGDLCITRQGGRGTRYCPVCQR